MKMEPANNVEKIAHSEQKLLNFEAHPTLCPINDGRHLETSDEEKKAANMHLLQHFLFTLLIICVLAILAISTVIPDNSPRHGVPAQLSEEQMKFRELLNSVEPASLHEVLHQHMSETYQHGVFQEDKTAMEAVHRANAEVAHSLIELAKRQASSSSNGTTVVTTATTVTTDTTATDTVPVTTSTFTTASPSPTSNTVSSTSPTTTAASVTETTTSTSSSAVASTTPTSLSSTATSSSQNTGSTSSSSSRSSVHASSSSGSTSSSTYLTSSATVSNSAVASSSTLKSSSSSSISSSSSVTSSQSLITSQVVFTTTLSNGAPATVTSVTVVPADQAEQTGSAGGSSKTSTGNASLQTSGANQKNLGLNFALGAVGMVVIGAL